MTFTPGLVKGIFFGRGNYNQDLSPLSLLLEVGGPYEQPTGRATGHQFVCGGSGFVFYGPSAEAAELGQGKAAKRSITGLLFFVGTGATIFYVINAGGFAAAWKRLTSVLNRNRLR